MSFIDHWLERWLRWEDRRRRAKSLSYSIRRCHPDEIEVRPSVNDGLTRGFFRCTLFGGMLVISAMNSHYGMEPFFDLKRDYEWVFTPDIHLKPMYEDYDKRQIISEQEDLYPLEKLTYEEYKAPYLERFKWTKFKLFAYAVLALMLLFLLFWPRARGMRINRKERVIYWQRLDESHSVTMVPETGDPLSGLLYSKFGLYPYGWGDRWSLAFYQFDLETGQNREGLLGIYPTPDAEHNDELINAIRDFLSEDEPEFLSRIGKRYRTPWTRPMLFLCNSLVCFSWPFNRQRADAAIARAKAGWATLTPEQQNHWFAQMRERQQKTDFELIEQNHDNRVPWIDPRTGETLSRWQ